MKKRALATYLLAFSIFIFLLTSCGNKSLEGKTVKIGFANGNTDSMRYGGAKFKEIAEKESQGTLEVVLFPDNQLGSDRVQIESTQFGNVAIGTASTSPIATMFHDFYLFDAPYLFLSTEQAHAVMDGKIGTSMLKDMEKIGLKGLCLWENGFRDATSNEKPIISPNDLKGMKLRTMENDIQISAWKLWGANPTPMAFTEVFTGLQQGTIDGQENPIGVIDSSKIQEVQKYVSLTDHVYTPFIVAMNLDVYNSLTDVQKRAIDIASKESAIAQREEASKINERILNEWREQGITITELSEEQKSVFRDMILESDIYDRVKAKMDHPEYLDEILDSE